MSFLLFLRKMIHILSFIFLDYLFTKLFFYLIEYLLFFLKKFFLYTLDYVIIHHIIAQINQEMSIFLPILFIKRTFLLLVGSGGGKLENLHERYFSKYWKS